MQLAKDVRDDLTALLSHRPATHAQDHGLWNVLRDPPTTNTNVSGPRELRAREPALQAKGLGSEQSPMVAQGRLTLYESRAKGDSSRRHAVLC